MILLLFNNHFSSKIIFFSAQIKPEEEKDEETKFNQTEITMPNNSPNNISNNKKRKFAECFSPNVFEINQNKKIEEEKDPYIEKKIKNKKNP
jgi:hypothetical protein